jgi:hypothetical protein
MNMKRLIIFIAAIMLPVLGFSQAQINTKKVKIGDFTQKITKVVLTGNMFYDSTLENEIIARWKISPYEFCSLEEFEELKGNEEYYFLLTIKGQFKKESEPGLQFLTLVKGGAKAEKGINSMLEIVSLPVASAEDPSGRELEFLPAFLDIIQTYTLESMERDIQGYGGLSNYSLNLPQTKDLSLIFSEDDLSQEITDEIIEECFIEDMTITTATAADNYMSDAESDVVVSYVVAPTDAKAGSYCYKMLIGNQSHKVYYFRKHRIGKNLGAGFLAEDIKRIASYRLE